MLHSTDTKENNCPYCNYELDTLSDEEGATPEEGDISLCANCCNILMLNADLTVRKPTDLEISNIAPETMEAIENAKIRIQYLIDEGRI